MSETPKIRTIKREAVEEKHLIVVDLSELPEPTQRDVRIEIGYLEVLTMRYPEAARRFVRKMETA